MRAGIFTDGGKRERERAAAKARKRALANGSPVRNDPFISPTPEDVL
jgi:hypothetical protein